MTNTFRTTPTADATPTRSRVQDHEGSLVLLQRTGPPVTLATVHGEASATPARLLIVDDDVDGWMESLVFPVMLQAAIKDDSPVLGVVGRGDARPGKSAPWVLHDPTPEQVEKAEKVWAANEEPPF